MPDVRPAADVRHLFPSNLILVAVMSCVVLAGCQSVTDSPERYPPLVLEASASLPPGVSGAHTRWFVFLDVLGGGFSNIPVPVTPSESSHPQVILEFDCGLTIANSGPNEVCGGHPIALMALVSTSDSGYCGMRTGFIGRPGHSIVVTVPATIEGTWRRGQGPPRCDPW